MLRAIIIVFLAPLLAHAFEGEVSFTAEEIAQHAKVINQFNEIGAKCLHDTQNLHRQFYERYGISAFYGDQSDYAKLSRASKRAYLRDQLGLDPKLVDQLQPISCVGLALRCLAKSFNGTGQGAVWEKLAAFGRQNAQDGTAIQLGLQKLGWKVLYWNPDVRMNRAWDQQEQEKWPENGSRQWGYHEYRWIMLQRTGKYYQNPVDDARLLVNIGTTAPAFLRHVPFFIGTAHTGYHVFPGAFGLVVEGHSVRNITAHDMVETAWFNPLAEGGAPNGAFRSGILAVPPGSVRGL